MNDANFVTFLDYVCPTREWQPRPLTAPQSPGGGAAWEWLVLIPALILSGRIKAVKEIH